MADMVPIGVDRLTGEGRPVLDADVITTPNGTVLTGGKPTPSAWGVNVETLAGNKTLLNSDDVVQFLDPDGTDRLITLPTITVATPFFKIVNDGSLDDTSVLLVLDVNGGTVAAVQAGQGVDVYSDGVTTAWKSSVFSFSTAIPIGDVMVFQGNETATYAVGMNTQIADTTIGSPEAFGIVTEAATVTQLFRDASSTGADTYEVYVNGVLAGSVDATSSGVNLQEILTFPVPFAVAAGDVIHINSTNSRGPYRLGLLTSGTTGYNVIYGGQTFGVNYFYNAIQQADISSNMQTIYTNSFFQDVVIAGAVTASAIAMVSNSSSSPANIDIFKNGVSSETVAITTTLNTVYHGSQTASTVFADGDKMTLRSTSVNTSQTHLAVLMTGGARQAIQAGQQGNLNTYLDWFIPAHTASANSTLNQGNQIVCPANGVPKVSWNQQTAPTADHSFWKNGVQSETINMQSLAGTATLSTVVVAGDVLAIRCPTSGTQPGFGNIMLTF